MKITAFRNTSEGLELTFSSGKVSIYNYLWLRNNTLEARHPRTRQRVISFLQLPAEPNPETISINTEEALCIEWKDGAKSQYSVAYLQQLAAETQQPSLPEITQWLPQDRPQEPLFDYQALEEQREQLRLLTHFYRYGLAVVDGVPQQDGQVLKFTRRFGFVRETNYGELFDVRTVPEADHLAYTGVELPLHTDNPYRSPVPGIQLLHCLQSDVAATSTFADGFQVAELLRKQSPKSFELLTQTPVRFSYRSQGCWLQQDIPIIQVDAVQNLSGICFNDRSMAALPAQMKYLKDFYSAYRDLSTLMLSEQNTLEFLLKPGQLVIFDNHRVLHGRKALSANTGTRWLQGCYADHDSFQSNLRCLQGKYPSHS